MYAIFEVNSDDIKSKGNDSMIKIDSNIQSLSWMSKSNLLNNNSDFADQKQFQQEGWLATGNSNFMVGCTFTSTNDQKSNLNDFNSLLNTTNLNRTNFNLRGHKSEIKLVRWNEAYQKLASCDSKGVIYVWVKYEGRWSIELINDRNNQVTDFAWSHDGRQAVICYQDGFVLVGSVNGQRYWSNLYDLSNSIINSATWTPNDAFILLGLSNGSLMLVDENGVIVNKYTLSDHSITKIAYNCPKFFISELFEMSKSSSNNDQQNNRTLTRQRLSSLNFSAPSQNQGIPNIRLKNKINNSNHIIAILLESNIIHLIKSYDLYFDPVVINTKLDDVKFEWSSCGKILCVGGHIKEDSIRKKEPKKLRNFLKFYNQQGILMYELEIPTTRGTINKKSLIDKLELKQKKFSEQPDSPSQIKDLKCLTALTWGHNDQRLFVSCSNQLHILRVYKQIPSLSCLSQYRIKSLLNDSSNVKQFVLPERLKQNLKQSFLSTVKMTYPKQNQLRKFVSTCLPNHERLHCTLKRMNIKSNHDYYILYLEYLGGLVPLLSAKKVSKLKPDFVIFDPYLTFRRKKQSQQNKDLNLTKKIPISKTFNENIENIDLADDIRRRIEPSEEITLISRSISSLVSFSSCDLSSTSSLDNLSIASSYDSLLIDELNQKKKMKNKFLKLSKTKKDAYKVKSQKIQKRSRFNTNRFSHRVKDNSLDMNSRAKLEYFVAKKNKRQKSKNKDYRNNYLVQVTSNFWGTKFKFHGHKYLPQEIGQIVYKTSLFHLQPRQMTITLEDLTDENCEQIEHKKEKSPIVSSISGIIPYTKKISKSISSSCSSLDELNSNFCGENLIDNLPSLHLASPNSTQLYNDSTDEEVNYLITSETKQERSTDRESLIDKKIKRITSDYLISLVKNNFKKSPKLGDIPEESFESAKISKPKQFILHNKPPIWNETSQVYQLDFGGRVTQESAKNFQVEYLGKQVMQFGRIDTNAYTLDFEWPFTTVQAFSIALANITQRLK